MTVSDTLPTCDHARLIIHAPHAVELPPALMRFVGSRRGQISELRWSFTDDTARERVVYRARFALEDLRARLARLRAEFAEEVAARFGAEFELVPESTTTRAALTVSRARHGPCLRELLREGHQLPLRIVHVLSSHEDLRAEVETHGIDYTRIPVPGHDTAAAERARLAVLAELEIDLLVVAGSGHFLGADLLGRVGSRGRRGGRPVPVISSDCGSLPALPWARPSGRARRPGEKIVVVTARYARGALDEGPVIEQDTVRVDSADTEADLCRKAADREREVLLRSVRWHCEGRVFPFGDDQTVVLL